MLLRNNPTPLKHHPWSVANCTASWMTAILQILQHHNLIHHTMNYNIIIIHRASRSRTIHSGTGECMSIFWHCLHNSRYAILLYQLVVLPSSVSSAWGVQILQTRALQIIRQNIRGAYVHQKQWNYTASMWHKHYPTEDAIIALNTIIYVLLIQYFIAERLCIGLELMHYESTIMNHI